MLYSVVNLSEHGKHRIVYRLDEKEKRIKVVFYLPLTTIALQTWLLAKTNQPKYPAQQNLLISP
jgi:P pilus assembly chaperone PapD